MEVLKVSEEEPEMESLIQYCCLCRIYGLFVFCIDDIIIWRRSLTEEARIECTIKGQWCRRGEPMW